MAKPRPYRFHPVPRRPLEDGPDDLKRQERRKEGATLRMDFFDSSPRTLQKYLQQHRP